ncbi:MAG TPA: undecaprenyldiphospho-muramoylpentapeptide beta-N-acetylglucosaminyltransferase [Stellaceae bacterium]|nr:undecaprenyldiphospho-muramoylpentapeptide beta-N-acetylglucosaminyltransferase [Stellaceae bacterium]
MREPVIALAAGGTGGHMFPAEALARELLRRGCRVVLITDRRGQAFGDRVPGVALHRIRAGRLGAGLAGKIAALAETALGTLAAARLLRLLKPASVVGFGGYPSLPTMLAATRLGMPTLLHEQNALLGRANRLIAPRVGRIATSFAAVGGLREADRGRVVETGNPVRDAVAAMRFAPYAPPQAEGPLHLLVTGGSQGARILGVVVPGALAQLPPALRRRLVVTQQARSEDLEAARHTYAASGIAAETAAFFDDIPARLARAQLVICRAGASTVAELAVVGRPAILVPYRYAAEDHQTANANGFAAAGAAWVMPEAELTPALLAERIAALLAAPAELAAAAAAAQRLGRPDAAARLADLVIAAAGGSNGDAELPREKAA